MERDDADGTSFIPPTRRLLGFRESARLAPDDTAQPTTGFDR